MGETTAVSEEVDEQVEGIEEGQAGQQDDLTSTREDVVLSADQYDALIDRLEELETSRPNAREDLDDIDALAEEGKRPIRDQQSQVPENLDDMTNTQLANYVMGEVSKSTREVLTEVQTLKVFREIDKCEAKYDDFWSYEKEIYAIASKSPTLSIEDAYKLAKSNDPNKGKPAEKTLGRTKTEKLLRLPSRVPSGEKPNVSTSTTHDVKSLSTRDAANKAWDEISKGIKKE